VGATAYNSVWAPTPFDPVALCTEAFSLTNVSQGPGAVNVYWCQ
jgi:hypothetical protein